MAALTGSCLCRGVRFEVAEPFQRITQCHCTSCKKLSGGVGTTNGRAATRSITILEGEELLRTYQPPEGVAKTFCTQCGSNLFGGGWPESEYASVRLSTLDEPFPDKPQVHLFVRSVAPWETLPDDGAERFDAQST